MTYQISTSGGLGSAISALIAYENDLDFNMIFADTLIEDEDLYRFLDDVSAAIGKPYVHLKDGRTPWDVFVDKRYIGNTRTAHCSTELKTKPVKAWIDANALPDDPLVLGMDWSEMDRIERAKAVWAPRPVASLLNQFGVVRDQYADILKRHGIAEPRLYGMGFSHNNCGGFCVKAGQNQFARLLEHKPEAYAYHEQQMIIATDKIGPTARPFLRKSFDGEVQYLTLTEFREQIETGEQIDMFSSEGCGCFTDEVTA